MKLYDHQESALNRLGNGKILWGGVGTGKSLVAAAYYIRKEAPRDVYVITTARKRDSFDWEKEFARVGVGKDDTLHGHLTVDSWNNIGRYREVEGAFFIFDEQRLVGSGEWAKNFLTITKRNTWILLTATPGDTWLDYIPIFIANGFYKNRTQFKREHVVYAPWSRFPKVDRYVGVGRLVRLRDELLVEMPYVRATTRHSIDVHVDHDEKLFERVLKDRWHVYENRPLRDVAELFLVMRKVVNTSPSRLDAVQNLLTTHSRLIVFYNFDYELHLLRSMLGEVEKSPTPLIEQSPKHKNNSIGAKETTTFPSTSKAISERTDRNTSGGSTPRADTTSFQLTERKDEQWLIHSPVSIESSELESNGREAEGYGEPTQRLSTASVAISTSPDQNSSKVDSTNTISTTTSGSSFQVAEWNGHKHQPVPTSKRWVYLVQYVAGAEAWNCVTTNAICFYSLPYSYKIWEQAHGRIDRLNTIFRDLFYYRLLSNSVIDKIVTRSLDQKKSFNEGKYAREKFGAEKI